MEGKRALLAAPPLRPKLDESPRLNEEEAEEAPLPLRIWSADTPRYFARLALACTHGP